MNIETAVLARRSVRAYLDTEVDASVLRRVLSKALRAPSGGNLQPWQLHVVAGSRLAELKALMGRVAAQGTREPAQYDIYPDELASPYRERRFAIGESMYATLGIPREDRAARQRWFARNFEFFGAPVGMFCTIDRQMGPPQWSDLGMLLQTIMLLLTAEGLGSCAQECWALYPQTVGRFLELPKEQMLFAGMAIGYEDRSHPVNSLQSSRVEPSEVIRFVGN